MRKTYKVKIKEKCIAIDIASESFDLSKEKLKKLFSSGAVWIKLKGKERLNRKLKRELIPGEELKVYYDDRIAPADTSKLQVVHDTHNWGVWYKPVNLLCQGTKYGDEFTLLRQVEKRINKAPFLIHRLDKETSGLIIMAYNKKAARLLSESVKDKSTRKYYQAEVKGIVKEEEGVIETQVDEKDALTKYRVLERREKSTIVEAEIITGRKHQIRVHFNEIGHPVLGDSRYGKYNSDDRGLQLVASKLILIDPYRKSPITIDLPSEFLLY